MTKKKENLLITGASSGVGYMLASQLCDDYNVVTISRRVPDIKSDNITSYSCDLLDKKRLKEALNKIKEDVGHCPNIINCAGVLQVGETNSEMFERLDKSIKINAIAPFIVINSFVERMKVENYGNIINLTSGAPLNCFPDVGAYSASKSMLNSLTITLAKECLEFNISINLMSPGPVKSEMNPNSNIDPIVCLPTVKYLLNGNERGCTDSFFWLGYKVPLFPDLDGVNWLDGIGNSKLQKLDL